MAGEAVGGSTGVGGNEAFPLKNAGGRPKFEFGTSDFREEDI